MAAASFFALLSREKRLPYKNNILKFCVQPIRFTRVSEQLKTASKALPQHLRTFSLSAFP